MKSNQRKLEIVEDAMVRIAVLGGLGYAPLAPGTIASLTGGLPTAWALSAIQSPGWRGASLLLLLIISWLACEAAARKLGKKDPQEVVVDELAGTVVTLYSLPVNGLTLAAGFVLFRIFDIWKPWPIREADARVPGGLGILLDDILAGILAHLTLRAILLFF